MAQQPLDKYMQLLSEFLSGALAASGFELRYLHLYKNDPTAWSDAEFRVLDGLFGAVDAYCSEPALRDANDLDEAELRSAAKAAVDALRRIQEGYEAP